MYDESEKESESSRRPLSVASVDLATAYIQGKLPDEEVNELLDQPPGLDMSDGTASVVSEREDPGVGRTELPKGTYCYRFTTHTKQTPPNTKNVNASDLIERNPHRHTSLGHQPENVSILFQQAEQEKTG